MSSIRSGLSKGDTGAVGRAARRLRGTLSTLGAEAAVEPAQRLELSCRENDFDSAEKAFGALQSEIDRLDPELAAIAQSFQPGTPVRAPS